MSTKKIELLSPAGNMDSLKAAIFAGCDAVYLSGNRFGARAFASNFTNEEIIEAINFSHLYGVKVYVTVNTLVYESAVPIFMKYIDFLHRNSVDAIIIQDIGMMDLIRKTYPNLEIHASTQMHIHNVEGVKLLESLGIKRAVLARETPIELINEIKKNTNTDIEIFIHGALCISYSGQCLMSSLIGGRSGNRGTCAGSCRQSYDLIVNNNKVNIDNYLLSTKDLCTLNNIGKLIDIGVNSLKIEGRMKRPEYVYLVTSLYRKAIDSYIKNHKVNITNEDIKNLKKIFNRKFTKGFIFHEENDNFTNPYRPNHMGIEIGQVINYKKPYVYIQLKDSLNKQDGIRFVKDDIGLIVTDLTINNNIAKIKVKDRISTNSSVVKTTDYQQLQSINDLIKQEKKIAITITIIVNIDKPIILVLNDGVNNVAIASEYIVQSSTNNPTTKQRIIEQITKLGNTIYLAQKTESIIDDNVFIPIKILNDLRREAITLLNQKRLYKIPYKKEKYEITLKDFKKEQKKYKILLF